MYVSQCVKYHIKSENLKEYGYQGLDPGTKVCHLLNGIRCDKLSMVTAEVKIHIDKYEKDFNIVVTYFTQYIDEQGPTPSVTVVFIP